MKRPVRLLTLFFVVLLIMVLSPELFAGVQPPDPGGDPTAGGTPVGGGAPVGHGGFILLSAGMVYLGCKLYKIKRASGEPETTDGIKAPQAGY